MIGVYYRIYNGYDGLKWLYFFFKNYILQAVLSDEEVVEYADGVGFHWYSDYMVVPGYFTILNNTKELFRIGTEAANGK